MGPMIPKEMKYNLHYGKVRDKVFNFKFHIYLIYEDLSKANTI